MESHLPTRPSSDLHRRLSARKRPPAAIETQRHALPGYARRNRQRSSSFSAIGQVLSRLMPSNRPERGGTAKPIDSASKHIDNPSQPKTVTEIFSMRGRASESGDDGEKMRRTKSWSPKKIAGIANERDEGHQLSKMKTPDSLKRLQELHKTANPAARTNDLLQNQDRLNSHVRELRRPEHITLPDSPNMETNAMKNSIPLDIEFHESVAALKRSQQMFEEKKARREERRSFRESDDFIGVQGVNPRTGYPDHSTATSSSTGDVLSESVRQKLEEDEKRMATASREYKAALERREKEMRRLEMERERRRKEKKERAEKKRAQLRAKVKKDGRWINDGNTWSMVTESESSPVLQPVNGTPTHETISPYRAHGTSVTADEEPFRKLDTTKKEDYFHRALSPPEISKRCQTPDAESASHAATSQRRNFYHIKPTPPEKTQRRHFSVKTDTSLGNDQGTSVQTNQNLTLPIRRKEVGSVSLRRQLSSSETVVHKIETDRSLPIELPDNRSLTTAVKPPHIIPELEVTTPGETTHKVPLMSATASVDPFLDIYSVPSQYSGQQENEAIVTLYQSAMMTQGLRNPPLLRNPYGTFLANRIYPLTQLPPVVLKNPISARIPSTAQSQWTPFLPPALKSMPGLPQQDPGELDSMEQPNRWRRCLTREIENQIQGTITPITTITGYVGPPQLLSKLGGLETVSGDAVSIHWLTMANSIHTPNSPPREMPNCTPNPGSPMNQADIATLSAHHPRAFSTPIKQPITWPCQPPSTKPEKSGPKSTLTSTSMSLQQLTGAKSAAQAAFMEASPRRLREVIKIHSTSSVSPKARTKEIAEGSDQERKVFPVGTVDIEDLLMTPEEMEKKPQLLRKRIEQAEQICGPSRSKGEGKSTVRCTYIEKTVRFVDEESSADQKISQNLPSERLKENQSLPIKNAEGPSKSTTNISLLQKIYKVVMAAVGTAWWLVSPLFNPWSGLMWRWGKNELTWQDILIIGAAGIFGGGAFVMMVLFAKLLGMGIQIAKRCVRVGKVLAQV